MTINSTIIQSLHQKPILIDYRYITTKTKKPILIFCHGYKGFKDWGAWNLMADAFAKAGFCFIKFNFSHNGGTINQPIDFPDLEAFGNNNYTKELDDLKWVIDWAVSGKAFQKEADVENIFLVGHSRGGGIVSIKAEEDSRIKAVISIAGVCDYKVRFPSGTAFENWKNNGVYYVENARTKQQMPHYFQFHEDFKNNEMRLTIERAVRHLKVPHLIVHGDSDTSVSIEDAQKLHQWNPNSILEIIKGANHVFGASHPWDKTNLPQYLEVVIKRIVSFLK